MTQTSARFATVPPSGIREIFDLALTIPDAIHLEIGAPDFPTPEHIVEAAAQAARDGFTRYTPTAGLGTLRELIADKVRHAQRDGLLARERHLRGRRVLRRSSQRSRCCSTRATACSSPIRPGRCTRWRRSRSAARSSATRSSRRPASSPTSTRSRRRSRPNTRVLVTNSPGNPTGGVHRRETVEALLAAGAEARPVAHLGRGLRGLRLRGRARDHRLARRRRGARARALHLLEDVFDDRLAHGLLRRAGGDREARRRSRSSR